MKLKKTLLVLLWSLFVLFLNGQSSISFTVSMEEPASHIFHVQMKYSDFKEAPVDLKMPVWTPGYYQRLNFANNVMNFGATDLSGNKLNWEKVSDNTWRINTAKEKSIVLEYDVKTNRAFVATPYLDTGRAYILPAGVFLYPDKKINHSVTVSVKPFSGWNNIATGLDPVLGKQNTYSAPDYDVLYDCPLLVGNLDELSPFSVKGIPHRFLAYKAGNFDKVQLMNDLKKIVESASDLIGDIPYKHYTFIGIGPGAGGIEHLNSTTVSFSGNSLNSAQSRLRTLFFLAHEYFHHYNVKRIRPIELGPFDYEKGSRTKQLWISEGLSVYYEYLVVKRAGLCSEDELIDALRSNMMAFENKPGRHFQSLAEASFETWSDGPFGRTGDEVNKTISYYNKGPIVGLLLDFKIRHMTKNKRSLDDVMRSLYKEYYQQKQRGFTEEEFKSTCEKIIGSPIDDILEYVYTTKEIDYKKYFDYAGLDIDTAAKELQGGWFGVNTRTRNDSVFISSVDYESPAWNTALRQQNIILEINGEKAQATNAANLFKNKSPGDKIELVIVQNNETKKISVILGRKTEKTFQITHKKEQTTLQKTILQSWLD